MPKSIPTVALIKDGTGKIIVNLSDAGMYLKNGYTPADDESAGVLGARASVSQASVEDPGTIRLTSEKLEDATEEELLAFAKATGVENVDELVGKEVPADLV